MMSDKISNFIAGAVMCLLLLMVGCTRLGEDTAQVSAGPGALRSGAGG